jgi:hypothetical protein
MEKSRKVFLLVSMLVFVGNLFAYNHHQETGKDKEKPSNNTPVINAKANCAPATAKLTMQFNDISALLEAGGILFFDRANGVAAYEVPKGSRLTAIFSGALWMGGTDVNGQLKLAGQTFRQGVDFWTGPLTVTAGSGDYDPRNPVGDGVRRDFGEANINPDQCLAYDKFFTIRKAEVIQFNVWWECNNVPDAEGCDDIEIPSNELLNRINNWPAHGDITLGQDFYLAPFYDRDQNGIYDPLSGDHPWYDDILGRDDISCGSDRRISLFGDETHWWVFNDKGNIHTETSGDPIGMEIRAQAFAFTTDDEVNRMTFYNYELINRGTQTLQDTYFAKWLDPDLGGYNDDYVGCDVSRGLGYCLNGDNFDDDQGGRPGYGANPPAIGVDFFEGPYQDADGIDNPGPHFVDDGLGNVTYVVPTVAEALNQKGIVYSGLGIGYSDGIIDNERFGMKGFTYFTGAGAAATQSDPSTAAQYYNYMTGKWRFGDQVFYGGTGFNPSNGVTTIPTRYTFPGDSDSLNWGTAGVDPGFDWDEQTNNNPPGDRRFVQAAGPFTLKPGAVNNITVGIVYARSYDGDLFASVRALKRADTKAQALFDNCFKIFDPPSAPKMNIQELENEIIIMLENPASSNNYNEEYAEEDRINIIDPGNGVIFNKVYTFEGYQIFQMKDEDASVADIRDVTKARLVAQCDIKNNVSKLINFEFDEDLGFSVPEEKVRGENKGIRHSFSITEDQFAQGERRLVNHKTYYYIAVAYAYNNYKTYNPNDPEGLDGQKRPYVSSRNNYDGGTIIPVAAIPHNPMPELGGTNKLIEYGSSPEITRLDGRGNGNRAVDLTDASVDYIIKNGFMENPTYRKGAGPINIKVVDPLNLADGYFECKFEKYSNIGTNEAVNYAGTDTASWVINHYDKKGGTLLGSVTSHRTINISNEQIIPEWGISVQIFQDQYFHASGSGPEHERYTPPIGATIEFKDSSKPWLSFVQDNDAFYPTNWIRSGDYAPETDECNTELRFSNPCLYPDEVGKDTSKSYAKLLGGGIAPYRLVGFQGDFMPLCYPTTFTAQATNTRNRNSISRAPSIDIVLTADKSKWTRCAVVELGRDTELNVGSAKQGELRKSLSVNKEGQPDGSGTFGMGWFPGYAIDVETGMRLHMAFGENSFLGAENGADLIWNPTSRLTNNLGDPLFGGLQPFYVFGYRINGDADETKNCPYYDGVNNWVYDKFVEAKYSDIYMNLTWVANPILTQDQKLLSTDVKIRVRVNKEYNDFVATGSNGGKPMYSWTMDGIATDIGNTNKLKEALDLINVVPNPYYAFSEYERTRIDTRVKITNLPDKCTINIYNVSGKLIRTFKKDSPITSLDWDMKNQKGIPIASGVYLIHVDVPNAGERVIKFFGGVRQLDLEGI